MRINKDVLIFLGIYLVVLAFMLHYNLTHPIINDGVYEYRDYMLNIQEGWRYRYSLVNSCLVSVWLPAMIQRLTNWDTLIIFRVFPAFFYALMPSFVYIISRRYLEVKYAIVSVVVVVFSSYIIFFPDVGRMGVVFGLMAGMVWALLSKRVVWSGVFATLVVFAHYGTTVIAIGLIMSVIVGILVWQKFNIKASYPLMKPYLITFCVILVFTGVWDFGFSHYSGESMWYTLSRADKARNVIEHIDAVGQEELSIGEWWGLAYDSENGTGSILNIKSRDAVTQQAFGVGFVDSPIPLKIEIIVNWVVVALISLGLLFFLREKDVDAPFKIMALVLYGLVVATVVIPSFSFFYGTQRVYFTAMVALAVCFPFGIVKVARWLHTSPMILSSIVLGLYAVTTSGLIYLPFGLVKTLPVVLTLP